MNDDKHFRHNIAEVDRLNQRGGRMLSLVDLVRAGTLDAPCAAWLATRMAEGASVLTAAQPGGAGKTTIMAALLGFLSPGVRIETVSDASVLDGEPDGPTCYLVHEIGSGPYYAYLWDDDVTRFLDKAGDGRSSVASNLHADTMEELTGSLVGQLDVPRDTLANVDLILFIRMRRGMGGVRRWVNEVWVSNRAGDDASAAPAGANHRTAWRCEEYGAPFEASEGLPGETDPAIRSLLDSALNGARAWTIGELRRGWLGVN